MVEQIIEGISPTRMELLDIRKKLMLAEKGHKLLEEKRDALVEQFFSVIERRNTLSEEIDGALQGAFLSLIQAQMIMGEDKVKEASSSSKALDDLSFETDNVMGVKIPKIIFEDIQPTKPSYDFSTSCAKLDDAQQQFSSVLMKLLELADLEGGIKSLAVEIEKTKRRVNVLENTLIPKLHATRKYIEMQLEEREREDFFRRKRIKSLMESKKVKT